MCHSHRRYSAGDRELGHRLTEAFVSEHLGSYICRCNQSRKELRPRRPSALSSRNSVFAFYYYYGVAILVMGNLCARVTRVTR